VRLAILNACAHYSILVILKLGVFGSDAMDAIVTESSPIGIRFLFSAMADACN
jgi:hypothetical protein